MNKIQLILRLYDSRWVLFFSFTWYPNPVVLRISEYPVNPTGFFHVKWWVKEVNEMSFQLNGLIDCLNYLLGPQVDYFWLWIEYVQIILNVFGPKKGLNTQNYLKHLPQKMVDTVLTHFFQGFWSPKLLTTELPKQTENSPENFM